MPRWLRRSLIVLVVLFAVFCIAPYLIPLADNQPAAASYAAPNGVFVPVNGITLYVERWGDPADPPVVLLHGLGGSAFTWRDNAQAIADGGYAVVAFDRPGFGLSDKPLAWDYSASAQADLAVALLDALGVRGPATLVGHSAGGGVVGTMALRHPDRVAALVLVNGALLGDGQPGWVGALLRFPPVARWAQHGLRAAATDARVRGILASAYADADATLDDDDYAGYLRWFATPGWEAGLVGLSRDRAGDALTATDLARISAPTLILWGADDTWIAAATADTLAAAIPNSTVIVYPGVGHLPMEEAPARFNADVLAFLGQHTTEGAPSR